MNRYSQVTTSEFNPLSFQEIMAAPLAMRQKHDNSIAAVEALRIQANPLDKHLSRALEIKNQMDAEIAKNVDILNKEGYNPTTFQNIIKLNRQYQDMISPTGEIGIINAAKIAEAKAKEDFMKNADKSFGQDVLEQRWLEHRQKYADINGRDKDGKIINIDNLGSPKYVDLDTGIKDVLSTLGSTTREKLLNSGVHFQNTDYGPVMVNAQGSVVTETNDKQLNDALNALKTRFINKTGEGRISRDFEGRTVDEDLAYINSRISAANVYKQNKDYKTNYDMISTGGGSGDGSNPQGGGVFGEDYNTKEVGGKNQDYSDLEKIGKSFGNTGSVGSSYSMGTDTSGGPKQKSGKFTSADIKDPRQKALYEKVFKNATTGKGIMLDGKLVHLSKDMQKFGKDDPRVAAQILRSIKQNPAITLTSKLLTTNQVLNDQGFVAGLGTTADDVDKNIRRQLQMTNNEGRKLIDPKTGKTVTFNEIADEYGVESINDVNYQGQISAHNWEEDHDKLGSNSRFSPHVVTIKTKDGWKTFKTTRLSGDNIGGNPARQNDLTKNYRNATVNYGDFVDFESSSNNLKGIKVKYNPKEQEYDSRTGEPKTWTIKFKNGAEEKATESQYMNWVNSIK